MLKGKFQIRIEELERKNYYLERENRILKGLVRDYQDQVRILESFILIVFILEKLVIRLYLLDFFDSNNTCVIIF